MALPKLKQQLADTKGIFKGKERKALTEQIQRAEKEIAEKLNKLPDVLKEQSKQPERESVRTGQYIHSVLFKLLSSNLFGFLFTQKYCTYNYCRTKYKN